MARIGLHTNHLNGRVSLFHRVQDAHHRPRGAQSDDHDIHLAVGLLVDLRSGAELVGHGIGGIVELVGHEVFIRVFAHQPINFFYGTIGAESSRREEQLSPQGLMTMLTSSDVARGKLVGEETLDGTAVKHYLIDGPAFLKAAQRSTDPNVRSFGEALQSAEDADLYVDSAGGYPVAFRGSYSGAFEPLKFDGDFSVQIELTGVNENTPVNLPSACNNPISR